jgi:hypothetical protein
MRRLSYLVLAMCWLSSVHAGDKEKPQKQNLTPSERIEQLLRTLQNDQKEDRRAKAADELGKLASTDYPEITSGLIDALVRDQSTTVRKAVIRSLASINPATHEVKDALDQAVKSDKSWSVRQVARIAVFRYKPKDEPQQVPGPKLRNTSKPGSDGKMNTKAKAEQPSDPLKRMPMPAVPTPVVPAVPAPTMAPGPVNGPITDLPPARLTAPKRVNE